MWVTIILFYRDERHRYIRLKYVDRKFCLQPADIEHELVRLMPSRPGDMEEELLNDSTEVNLTWLLN